MTGKPNGANRVTPSNSGKLKTTRTRNDGQKLTALASEKKYNESNSSKKYFQDSFRESVSDVRKQKGSIKNLQELGQKACNTSRHDH